MTSPRTTKEPSSIRLDEKEFENSDLCKKPDLACFALGSSVAIVTNNAFESAFRMIHPDPVEHISSKERSFKDGWSVHVKDGNDIQRCVIKLAHTGLIHGIDIDTTYFNFGEFTVSVEGVHCQTDDVRSDTLQWDTLLSKTGIKASSHNYFQLTSVCEYSHLRVSGYTNGGIARFHAYGHTLTPHVISARPLTTEAYAPYGEVIHPLGALSTTGANQGTASKFHHVAQVNNLFPQGDGKPNLCIFRCKPRQLPFTVKLLERHPYSTQAFIPMTNGGTQGYLVVVALNGIDDRPDMSTLRAFIASSTQGINYRQGVWHHPMIALDCTTDFVVLVHENGVSQDDCNEVNVPHVIVRVPGFQANL